MTNFAIIDIETTYASDVMSIGVVIARRETFELVQKRYYIITPFHTHDAMYTDALYINGLKPDLECSRTGVILDMMQLFTLYNINEIFAYNAMFDFGHLPELSDYTWYDIMQVAAYRQHNPKIPPYAECYNTGRLKRGYGVENMYRLLSNNTCYYETHNAVMDAIDELEIMRMLGHGLEKYEVGRVR